MGNDKNLRGVTCYDPSAGSGTLLMALAHEIGENHCSIYSQDISQKSSQMLRLNLILNNLAHSIRNVVQGNTLLSPGHKEKSGELRKFDFIISNPPFKLDFPDERDEIAKDSMRFWAGVPNKPKKVNPAKPAMKIFLCFIQHLLYSLKAGKGKGAIVVPTGFITEGSIERKILEKVVNEHIVYGCVSMPSNVFATTGTNVSVVFFDNSRKTDKVVLIDASKLGEEYKDGNNQRTRLRDFEIERLSKLSSTKRPWRISPLSSRTTKSRIRATRSLRDSTSMSRSSTSISLKPSSRSASPPSNAIWLKCRPRVRASTSKSPPVFANCGWWSSKNERR